MVVRSRTSRAEVATLAKTRLISHVLLGEAVGAAPIGNARQTGQRRDRPVDDAQHLAEGDLGGRHQQPIAAELAALAHDDAVVLQLEQDLLEEFAGDALLRRDLADHHGIARAGQRDQGAKSVFGFLRDHLGKSFPKLYLIDRVDNCFAPRKQCAPM